MLATLGAVDKIMWFRSRDERSRVGVHVTHNRAIALAEIGGGFLEQFQHAEACVANSWTLILELSLKE